MSLIWCNQCEYEENCCLKAIAADLTGCSGHSKFHHRYTEKKEKMMNEAKAYQENVSLANKELLHSLKIGDRVQLTGTTISLGVNLPRYLDYGVFKVLGFTKNGKVRCDWDGGKPFNIPPSCLRKIED